MSPFVVGLHLRGTRKLEQARIQSAAGYHPSVTESLYPAYIAFIRRELQLPPASDALIELRARLHPEDATAKPPYRAPGIVRLRRALRALERGSEPESELEQFASDLRFLQMFSMERPVLPQEAMQKLLSDVMNTPPMKNQPARPDAEATGNVLPFRTKPPREGGQP